MAFSNIGSDQDIFGSTTSSSDTTSKAIPSLAAESIGFVFVALAQTAQTVTGVTWNGEAMSAGPTADAGTYYVTIYYLANPPDNGTYDITATYSNSAIHHGYIVVGWADAGGAVSLDDTSGTTGTSQNPTITSTQAGANELVVSVSVSSSNGLAVTRVTDCTLLEAVDLGGDCAITAYSTPASSGDVTHQHNYSQSGTYAIASMSFQETTESSSVSPSVSPSASVSPSSSVSPSVSPSASVSPSPSAAINKISLIF